MTVAAPPDLREATFDDWAGIAALEKSQGLRSRPFATWARFWRDNPLFQRLAPSWPIGWVLESDAGQIVGCVCNIPIPYVYKGKPLVAAAGRGWAVAPEYRGLALMLMDEHFNQPRVDLLFNVTVNGLAESAFATFGSPRVPIGEWTQAAFFVTNYSGFAQSALTLKKLPAPALLRYPAGAALWTRETVTGKRLPSPPRSLRVEQAATFDARFDRFWDELKHRKFEKLLAVRDSRTLAWHFGPALEAKRVWILTLGAPDLQAYAIFQRHDHADIGLTRLRLIDYQSLDNNPDHFHALLNHTLTKARQEGIHVVERVGLNLPQTPIFDRYAPYRRKLPAWSFYYKADSPSVAKALENPEAWEPSSYDGDASL